LQAHDEILILCQQKEHQRRETGRQADSDIMPLRKSEGRQAGRQAGKQEGREERK